MYGYGLVYIVAGIFDFMSGEFQNGNTIVFHDVSEDGHPVEYLVSSIDELLHYYTEVIIKAKN